LFIATNLMNYNHLEGNLYGNFKLLFDN